MTRGCHSAAFELPYEDWQAICEAADREHKSKSELLRELVRQKLKEHGITPVKRKRRLNP